MKINWKSVLNNLDVLSDGKFLLLCRMHHESFDLLHDLIKDHQVFRQRMGWDGNLLKQQYPIYIQLLIFQYSLGACGSDCNNKWIAPHFEPFAFLWRELPQYCCPTEMISYNGHLPTKSYALAMNNAAVWAAQWHWYHGWHIVETSVYTITSSWELPFQERFLCGEGIERLWS